LTVQLSNLKLSGETKGWEALSQSPFTEVLYQRKGSGKSSGVMKVIMSEDYPLRIHIAASEGKLTPRLLFCARLPGNMVVVITEYLDPKEWRSLRERKNKREDIADYKASVEELLKNFSKLLKSEGGDEGEGGEVVVHGDFRDANIMTRCKTTKKEEKRVVESMVVDLDWAGVQHRKRYPEFVSSTVRLLEGIGPGEKILQKHDQAHFENIFFNGVR
jgi:hypothetical protein